MENSGHNISSYLVNMNILEIVAMKSNNNINTNVRYGLDIICFVCVKLAEFEKNKSSEEDVKENGAQEQGGVIPPRVVADALLTICAVEKADVKDAESIAMATIEIAHNPYICKFP